MRHARPYFELDRRSSGAHAIGHAYGVIVQHFVAADLDQCRRQAREISVKR